MGRLCVRRMCEICGDTKPQTTGQTGPVPGRDSQFLERIENQNIHLL